MSIFATVTSAPSPRTDTAGKIALFYAGILVVLAVTQLFTFDEFIKLIATFHLPFGAAMTYALAPLLVVCEVFAIPFLLRMTLSPAFRWVSMLLGWVVALLWTCVSGWIVMTYQDVSTVGFLGTLVDLIPGWWAVLVSLAFGVMAAWASWGMWPGEARSSRAKK